MDTTVTNIIQTVELCNRTAGANLSTFIRKYLGKITGFFNWSHTQKTVAFNTERGSELAQTRSYLPPKPILQQLDNGEINSEKYAMHYWLSGMGVFVNTVNIPVLHDCYESTGKELLSSQVGQGGLLLAVEEQSITIINFIQHLCLRVI